MRVHLYTVCWNEAEMLGFFFRHYDPWVERYVVFDDGSTDATADILRRHPKVEVRPFHRSHAGSFILSQQTMENEAWKESRGAADWVIVVDVDEHLQVRRGDNRDYLAACAREQATFIVADGYQIVSDDVPPPHERLATTRTRGAPSVWMSKPSIFNPNAIQEIGFELGRHQAHPTGAVRLPRRDQLLLLHYKYLGFERTWRRHQLLEQRRGDIERLNDWSNHYGWSRDKLREVWGDMQSRALDTRRRRLWPWRTQPAAERWWRAEGFLAGEG